MNTENISRKFGKKRKIIVIIAAIVLMVSVWTVWGNTALELNTYTVNSGRLPKTFDSYRIAHISDLHNCEMGAGNQKLLELLLKSEPDMIAITGDLIDSRNTDIEIALEFIKEAVEIAPCYYVTGNHEARLTEAEYEALENGLTEAGVIVLHDSESVIEKNGEKISVIGIRDPSFDSADVGKTMNSEDIRGLSTANGYTVLLSHRPEHFKQYSEADMDLVLSGHAHGGQVRLPFIGGLIAPNQGLLPKYDGGIYTDGNTSMIVNRGIGNSLFPFRFNNRPEVILIELKSAEQ